MKREGETVTLISSDVGVRGFGDFANMLAGVIGQPRFIPPVPMQMQSNNVSTTSGLSLATPTGREVHCEATLAADIEQVKKEDESAESKSSCDNIDGGGSGEEQDAEQRPNKKRYHRHTAHQIQEMERLFKECPHPDEKQRQEISRQLKLSPRQIKFWFQNKRTQVKAQHERQDNSVLRAENEKLKAENFALRDAVRCVACPSCGGPANLAEISFDEQQLRIENVRLREEIDRISAMASKCIGRHVSTPAFHPTSPAPEPTLNAFAVPPAGPGNELIHSPSVAEITSKSLALTEAEKPVAMELAVAAMEELLQVAQAGEPLWVLDPESGSEVIDNETYVLRFPRTVGPTVLGLKSETTRHVGLVIMNSSSLVETLMDTNCWADMFPSIVSSVRTLEILSTGTDGLFDGAIQLMYAEFQVPSPLVPTRENHFLRYSKRVDHLWVVVDVSIDYLHGDSPSALLRCRRRPSGCVIEEMPNGYSKVTWVEHIEADNRAVHKLYQPLVNSGRAFGAERWVCTLQRQCERIVALLANSIPVRDMSVIPNAEGRRSMLKLAERMSNTFCGGVSASTAHAWVTLAGSGADDVRVVIRKSVDDPGRPPGIVLSAATSLWLPVPPARVFQFLRDERLRAEWDILSNMGVVEEMVHVAKGHDPGNSVSLLRVNPINSNQSNMLILQECCTDESCSLVVYAPVDISAMSAVLNGGDPDCVALLPSGFAILPDGRSLDVPVGVGSGLSGGSLLTVAFQILVDHLPTATLSLGSVATVNKLISNTVLRIKGALSCENV